MRAAITNGTRDATIDVSEQEHPGFHVHPSDRRSAAVPRAALGPALGASTTFYRRGESIIIQNGSDECWGRIVRGAARLCVLQGDARRRIIDFLLPGDLLEPASCGSEFDLEAVCDGTVMAVHRNPGLEKSGAADPYVPREMRELSLAMASRFRRQILILGHSTAMGKLCAFLVEMQQRSLHSRSDTIVLPMSRYDIADYLGISVETVSRSLTALQARNAIRQIHKREIRILDRDALEHGWSARGGQGA